MSNSWKCSQIFDSRLVSWLDTVAWNNFTDYSVSREGLESGQREADPVRRGNSISKQKQHEHVENLAHSAHNRAQDSEPSGNIACMICPSSSGRTFESLGFGSVAWFRGYQLGADSGGHPSVTQPHTSARCSRRSRGAGLRCS